MDATNPDILCACCRFDLDFPICGKRLVVLRDLISLGQVGIEIILARKDALSMDFAIEGKPNSYSQFNSFFIQNWQRARLTRADRTDITIRLRGDRIDNFTSTKHFGLGKQFSMDFESDDGFVFHSYSSR